MPDLQPSPVPAVSIIIPAYNVAWCIRETLDSVFLQTFRDFEILLVNDGSPDTPDLEKTLKPYLASIRYIKQENRGLSGARNTGLRHARGEYISLLDGDDIWRPSYLEEQKRFLDERSEYDLVYCDAEFFGDSAYAGKSYMDCFPSTGEADFLGIVTRRCYVFVSVMAKRAAMQSVGEFDESLRSCEDFDYWLRFSRKKRIGYQKKSLVLYRKHKGSLSANSLRMLEYNLKVLQKAEAECQKASPEELAVSAAIARRRAEIDLLVGRRDLRDGKIESALTHLKSAREHFRSVKLALLVLLLRVAPALTRGLYQLRGRLSPKYGGQFL